MNSIKLVYAILLTSVISSAFGQSLSLEEVLIKAANQNLQVKIASNEVKIAEAQADYFKSNLKPGINLDLLLPNFLNTSSEIRQQDGSIVFQNISQNNSSISLGVDQVIAKTGGRVFLQTELQRFDDFSGNNTLYNGVPFRVGLIQPIFGFNPYKYDKRLIDLGKQERQNEYSIIQEMSNWEATQRYFNILVASANKETSKANKINNEKLMKITMERFNLGKTTEDELLQLEAQLKLAKLQETQAIYAEQNAIASLFNYLGESQWDNELSFIIPKKMTSKIFDKNELVNAALKNRPELIRYERELLEADRNISQTKSNHGVEANLFAGFGFAKGAPKAAEIYQSPQDEEQLSFSISVPIVDWGKRKSAISIANIQKDNVMARIAQEKIDFENDIIQKISLFERLQLEIELLQEIMQIAEERYEISNKRFVLGKIGFTNLSIAQQEKDAAKNNYILGLRNYWSSYYELRALTGLSNI